MRWLICCLVFPLSASAASVLLVPVDEKARVLADDLVEPFGAVKLTVKMAGPGSPALNCLKAEARDGCLANIGEKAKAEAVFIVTGAMKGPRGTLTLEMLVDGKVIKKESTRVNRGKVKAQMRGPIAALLKLIPKSEPVAPIETPKVTVTEIPKEPVVVEPPRRDAEPPKVVVDAPKKTEPVVLTPNKRIDLEIAVPPLPRQKKSKAGAVIVTVLAVAAAGTAATFAGLGFSGKGQLETLNGGQSNLSYADAVALRDTSNMELTVALGTGIGAGVAGVVAGILWGAE